MKTKIAFALDGLRLTAALVMAPLAMTMKRTVLLAKIHDLLDRYGPSAISGLTEIGAIPWVDYKLHDTPDTVAMRVKALIENGQSTPPASFPLALPR
mgnify:CR=1 FL=1